jgi:hypothetical protein
MNDIISPARILRGEGAHMDNDWSALTDEEKRRRLYLKQKETLDTFLAHGAISRAQYEKSLGDLTAKMGMEEKK